MKTRFVPPIRSLFRSHMGACLAALLAATPSLADEDPVVLTNEHVDLQVIWTGDPSNPLALTYGDEDHGETLDPTNVVVRIPESARLEIPDGLPELGPTGSPLWILPQGQDPDLLFLGWHSSVPGDVLSGPVGIALREVRGPGQVVLWQAGPDGLAVQWTSRDGLDGADVVPLPAGSHGHYNLGFSATGRYELLLRAEGVRAADGASVNSPDTLFRFEVLPVPPAEPARLSAVPGGPGLRPRLVLTGTPGATYRLETADVLGEWTAWMTVIAGADGVELEIDPPGPGAGRYVRAVTP